MPRLPAPRTTHLLAASQARGGRGEVLEEGRLHEVSKRPSGLGGNAPDFARGFSLAFEFAGAVLLFWLVGRFVDNRFDIEPWGQVVGAVIGWVGGFLHLYFKAKGGGWQTVPGTRLSAPEPGKKKGIEEAELAAKGDGQ
jgi:Putative F0F1-ATPase subunit Ca2+/Mg2+ transporter